jgi:hypothetical protein
MCKVAAALLSLPSKFSQASALEPYSSQSTKSCLPTRMTVPVNVGDLAELKRT